MSWWLREAAKSFKGNEERFFSLCKRILSGNHEGALDRGDPVGHAINHPVGHVTEALLRWWYRGSLEDGHGLPHELKLIFSRICDATVAKFRPGRVLLAAHVIALFRVDPDWAQEHLLPLFDWRRSEVQAADAWEGFLWSSRLYRPLITQFKEQFLATAQHYDALGDHGQQYAALLTYAALEMRDMFMVSELAGATRALPEDGLGSASRALVNALEGAGSQRAEYWHNGVVPYLRGIWPKSGDRLSDAVAENFGRLCIAADTQFPQALNEMKSWLAPRENLSYVVHLLRQSGLCTRFPEASLEFLDIMNKGDT